MDIEKLIDRLSTESLYADKASLEIMELCMEAATALSTLQAENEKLRAELERMKKIMREHGIMVIPSKYPGVRSEWNIPKPRGRRKTDMKRHTKPSRKKDMMKLKPRPREALGLLADEPMRTGKKMCHALFDPLWKGKTKAGKKRHDLYGWLSHEMGVPVEYCHFGYFDLAQLRRAYIILRGIRGKRMQYDNCGRIYFEEADHEVS